MALLIRRSQSSPTLSSTKPYHQQDANESVPFHLMIHHETKIKKVKQIKKNQIIIIIHKDTPYIIKT